MRCLSCLNRLQKREEKKKGGGKDGSLFWKNHVMRLCKRLVIEISRKGDIKFNINYTGMKQIIRLDSIVSNSTE